MRRLALPDSKSCILRRFRRRALKVRQHHERGDCAATPFVGHAVIVGQAPPPAGTLEAALALQFESDANSAFFISFACSWRALRPRVRPLRVLHAATRSNARNGAECVAAMVERILWRGRGAVHSLWNRVGGWARSSESDRPV